MSEENAGMSQEEQRPALSQTLTHDAFPHLSPFEWEAFVRMRAAVGEDIVVNILRTMSPEQHRHSAQRFMHRELMQLRAAPPTVLQTPATTVSHEPKPEVLKLECSTYKGERNSPILTWFVELDLAIEARRLNAPENQIAFALSRLGGRAKTWALGKRMADSECFASYEDFKSQLRLAFSPPKTEFRARAEFLDLKQGKSDLHQYVTRARYLVASIVEDPIDPATQVVIFMKGLNDGPVRTQLFREYPETLEQAITLALEEDFSDLQSKIRHGKSPKEYGGAEPMDLGTASTSYPHPKEKTKARCNRCQSVGHYAYECMAEKPVARKNNPARRGDRGGHGRRVGQSNVNRQ